MNKLLIGLLLVAVAGGAFFLLKKKKEKPVLTINKEWIIGKWKPETNLPNDSSFSQYRYDFQKDGNIVRSLSDSVKADTARYEWNKKDELVWSVWTPSEKENASDSIGKVFSVVKLTADSLQVQTVDSVSILFTKLK